MKTDKPKAKINPLQPASREKKRYVAFEIRSVKPLGHDADRKLIAKIEELLGVFDGAKAGVMRVKYDAKTQRGTLRIERHFVDHVRACFVMTKAIEGIQVVIRTLVVTGMLHKATEAMDVHKN